MKERQYSTVGRAQTTNHEHMKIRHVYLQTLVVPLTSFVTLQGYLNSQSLSFLICKTEMRISLSWTRLEGLSKTIDVTFTVSGKFLVFKK